MNYCYDIIVNLNENLIDFYEWEKEDEISYVLKTPFFRVDDKFFFRCLF